MRSQALLQPTRSLLKKRAIPKAHRVLFSYSQATRYPRRETAPARATSRTHKRSSSTTPVVTSAPPVEPEGAFSSSGPVPPEDPEDDVDRATDIDKAKRQRKPKAADAEKDALPPLPPGLNILWSPDTMESTSPSALPPPEIFQEVLTNFLITLHPQTQHHGAYPSSIGPPVEPTLALYCPIEGGDYIIDETVRELARKTDSDVVVLDAVQLAAGEWGSFGKAAAAVQLPQNPLHFRAPPSRSSSPSGRAAAEDEFDDENDYPETFIPSQMTLHVMTPESSRRAGRQTILSSAPREPPMAKTKAFFDDLINVSSPQEEEANRQGRRRSRIIYVRDYPTLAPSASAWYPSLLASVRQRRQGPISRPTSPVTNAMTIVFGMTPPIVRPSSPPSHTGPQSMLGLMNARQSAPAMVSSPARPGRNDHGEDELADKAREKRLRERLRKWERDDHAFHDEISRLPQSNELNNSTSNRPGIVVIGGSSSGFSGLPPVLASAMHDRSNGSGEDLPDNSQFFRTSVLIPSLRNLAQERNCRILRRREINELTLRMGLGAIGGQLDKLDPKPIAGVESLASESSSKEDSNFSKMWDDWGKHVMIWSNVKDIADRAVGSVVITDGIEVISVAKLSLGLTPIPWSAVVAAWSSHRSSREVRKAWVQESTGRLTKEHAEEEESDEESVPQQDEVIQRVKEDPDLTQHEQRLLGCIIDSASIPTSFNQVHLPPHTIDSVRTIVSLPLLHPSAFQQGILKQHSMTGCLLFGPPGTGKTLVVRALAKEAGCRMLAVQPSDVMDMYVGEGEKLVRSVFTLARRLSPCVIFLDEIDALFGARSSARETGGSLAHHGVITEFMQEMDGLKTNRDSNVIVIGATNRPFDLDDAVLRRLPRRLLVDLPGEKEREEILKILLRDEALAGDVDVRTLAKRTELFSGSDLKHLCVSAALDAVKEGITLPWTVPKAELSNPSNTSTPAEDPAISDASATNNVPSIETPIESAQPEMLNEPIPDADSTSPRVLHLRHFNKALKEITPSSSESLGSLSALRKWNEEFGEGQKKKRKMMWGKGLFGFGEPDAERVLDGRVS